MPSVNVKYEITTMMEKIAITMGSLYVECNIEALSSNHCCSVKAYSERVFVALVIQHAKCMRHAILSSVVFPALTIFFHIIS
jgi:hypothetical protein